MSPRVTDGLTGDTDEQGVPTMSNPDVDAFVRMRVMPQHQRPSRHCAS
jgi:hypothetical protein